MSLKGDKYETADEVKFRLEKTVVLYDDDPVYITSVRVPEDMEEKGEIARVFFRTLPFKNTGAETRKYLSSKKFDLAPFPMGYMNHNGEANFVSRSPVRQNRQGLSVETTNIYDHRGKQRGHLDFNQMIKSQGFYDMVKGNYPDFKEAGGMLNGKDCTSVAISRTFAFVLDDDIDALLLLHKGTKCGLAMKGDRGIKIPPKYHFLRQEMEAHRVPIL